MYALLIVDIASRLDEKPLVHNLLKEIEQITMSDKEVEQIFAGVFLIDIGNTISLLRSLLDSVETHKFPYKISFLELKPKFIT